MAISVRSLDVRYKDKHAVRNVSFHVDKGEIFGMIGANGAGKTTIIECVEGLRTKYKGTIDVLGIAPRHSRSQLYSKIGVQLQETSYQEKLKVSEIGRLFESFYPEPADFDALLTEFGLAEKKNSYIGKLSGGQRQKLSVILALMPNPEIVFLDELTTGLDPKSRRDIWETIKSLKARGITVFMTTHFMEEAEYLCDRVAIVRQGEIVALDNLASLIQNAGIPDQIVFDCDTPLDRETICGWEDVVSCESDQNHYVISCRADPVLISLCDYAARNNAVLKNVSIIRPSLEDIFFRYTGETLSDPDPSVPANRKQRKKVQEK